MTINMGIFGFGAIGQHLFKYINENKNLNISCNSILVRNITKYKTLNIKEITDNIEVFFDKKIDYVVECAGHQSVIDYGQTVLSNSSNFIITSIGSLTDNSLLDKLLKASIKYSKKIIIPSAGIGSLDILSAASQGKLKEVEMTVKKSSGSWHGTIAEESFDLKTPHKDLLLFEGTVSEGAKLYPQNVNISAAVAFAGIGLEKTSLKIISDSSIKTHIISIKAKGDFGEYTFIENVTPSLENEKTGKIVSLALIKTLKNLTSNFIVGS